MKILILFIAVPIVVLILSYLFLSFIYRPVKTGYQVEDKQVVFYLSTGILSGEKKMTSLDPSRLKILGHHHAKDSNSVYYKELKIEGAHSDSFEILYRDFAVDQNNVFWKDQILPGLNPAKTSRVITKKGIFVTDQVTTYNEQGKKVDKIIE